MTLQEIAAGYAAVLTAIADGAELHCIGQTWDDIYAGDVTFECQGWRFSIFNDCDSVDYTDSVTAPDGSKALFNELFDAKLDPICFPSSVGLDKDVLERQFKRARRAR